MNFTFTDNPTLGKFNEDCAAISKRLDQANAQAAEIARLTKRVKALEADLEECSEYFADRCDVVDGDYGEQSPNKEMQLYTMINETMYGPGGF